MMMTESSDWEEELKQYLETCSSELKDSSESTFIINGSELVDSCPTTVSRLLLNPLDTLETCNGILSGVAERSNMKFRLSSMPPEQLLKTGSTKVMEWMREYQCKKCGHKEAFKAEFEMYQAFNTPKTCNACNAGPNPWKMSSKLGQPRPEYCKDYQEIKVQEQIQNLGLGTIPRSVWVALEDDLVDSCKPGDDVLVIGTVCRRWKGLGKAPEERTEIELVIRSNFIQVQNNEQAKFSLSHEIIDEFKKFWKRHEARHLIGRDDILSSFCPQVYGLFVVKLAVAVILAGGVERNDDSGTRVRGEPHMLMVGDPGTGKSQLLKYAARLSQRSSGGAWNLEAGALVLADGGICCIDEFNGIRESDRTCIHEAMEQQSPLYCKGRLSFNDTFGYEKSEMGRNGLVISPDGSKPFDDSKKTNFWTMDTLRSYFVYIKSSIKPEMSTDISQIISRYYQRQRGSEYVNKSRTSVRLLQSIVRLSQGHARLLHHTKVEIVDVVNAILLIEASGGVPSSSQIIDLRIFGKKKRKKLRKICEGQGFNYSCELDDESVDYNPTQDDRKDNNNMVLTQVMSKLKNKFSFVETVMPKKKGSKKSDKSKKICRDSDSSSDEEQDPSQNVQLSSDDSDFESLNHAEIYFFKKIPESPNSNEEAEETYLKVSTDISKEKQGDNNIPRKINSSHSDLELSLNDDDKRTEEDGNKEVKMFNSLRRGNSSNILQTNEEGKRCKSDSESINANPKKRSRYSSPKSDHETHDTSDISYSPPKMDHETQDTSNFTENQSQFTKNVSKCLSLSSMSTLNRFKKFSAPTPTSSPECTQSSTVKTLADIFSQSQDDSLDLEL
ncbi:MCM9 [Lepeophtheirus salmonis]|uniref:DNA helicase n=1 Tax=Lepeophtheirus salmonis TaxID=72036 RepID=A0A7R8HAE1_LEPSM|nr:MCM9 [Lepeophtheirus salmonis]CAF2974420.1 MCM9 [Lepeophtheirus salmonis]